MFRSVWFAATAFLCVLPLPSMAAQGDSVVFSLDYVSKIQGISKDDAVIDVQSLTNNCQDRRSELTGRFRICKFGTCHHPTTVDGDAYGYTTLLPQLLGEGPSKNTEVGSKTVSNSVRVGPVRTKLPNTYLSYACGN